MKKFICLTLFGLLIFGSSYAQRIFFFNDKNENLTYQFRVENGGPNQNDRIIYSVSKNGVLHSVGNLPFEASIEPGYIRLEKIDIQKIGGEHIVMVELRSYNEYQFTITNNGARSLCTITQEETDTSISVNCVKAPCPTPTKQVVKIAPCKTNTPEDGGVLGKPLYIQI